MNRSTGLPRHPRSTQAERRARSRAALLESAARGLSRYGYGNLVLEQVAREAGYTRGALYHQFKDKEELALAVLDWVNETWWREVGRPAEQEPNPVAALLALARGHAVYCRRDVARVMMALRVEFSGQDHPVGREIKRVSQTLMKRCARLIEAGRNDGSIALAGQAPHDELLAARAVAGVLGLDNPPVLPSPDLAPRASAAGRPVSRTPPHTPGRSDELY
jgi:AcrR family transcriptional regulator